MDNNKTYQRFVEPYVNLLELMKPVFDALAEIPASGAA
jgi:hypothetical protein